MVGTGEGKEQVTDTACSETAADKLFSTKPHSRRCFSFEYLQFLMIILGIFGFEKSLVQNEVIFTLKIKIHSWEAMATAQQQKQFSITMSNYLEKNNARTLVSRSDLKWFGSLSNTSKNCLH